jgi:TonB family protein
LAPDFLVDPTNGRIVKAFYTMPMGILTATSGAPSKAGITDPEVENETLRRFGLETGSSPPTVLTKVDAELSEEARQANFGGNVHVSLVVDEQGNVGDVVIIDSPGLGLDEKVVEAIRQWKFKPALDNGIPVSAKATVVVAFQGSETVGK